MSILKNSFLHLISFKVQFRGSTGQWRRASDLRPGRDYRWRIEVQNQWHAQLTDWATGSYNYISIVSGAHPHYRYYGSDAYTGGWSNRFEIREGNNQLHRDKKRVYYRHFRWTGPLMVVDGMPPGQCPTIAISGIEQRGLRNQQPVPVKPNVE